MQFCSESAASRTTRRITTQIAQLGVTVASLIDLALNCHRTISQERLNQQCHSVVFEFIKLSDDKALRCASVASKSFGMLVFRELLLK